GELVPTQVTFSLAAQQNLSSLLEEPGKINLIEQLMERRDKTGLMDEQLLGQIGLSQTIVSKLLTHNKKQKKAVESMAKKEEKRKAKQAEMEKKMAALAKAVSGAKTVKEQLIREEQENSRNEETNDVA